MQTRASLLAPLTFAVALGLSPLSAQAGVLQIRDSVDLLSPADESAMRANTAQYPFDVRVFTDSSMADRGAFNRYTGAQVAAPNMVVIGIDPVHRFTSVHFGTGSRINAQHYRAIEDAGDPFFRQAQWRGGVDAILSSASGYVGSAPASYRPGSTSTAGQGFPWGIVIFGIIGVVVVAALVRAARRRQDGAYYTQGYADPYRAQPGSPYPPNNYGPGYGPGPGYYPPGGGGMGVGSVVGAGLAGAALGGVAGYALGRDHDNDHGGGGGHSSAGVYDSGGNDGGNYDAGGSSSGWDGGGGGDFGGGGDMGGGGGDW